MMGALLAVAGGGAIGATMRYLIYMGTAQLLGINFPFATLIINVVGSFFMGLLTEVMALVWLPSQEMRLFLATGILGSFTTFSTFSLDFAVLYDRGKFLLCAVYLSASVIASISAFFVGLHVLRYIVEARI